MDAGAMSVDIDREPVHYESVDNWLQRVGAVPARSSPKPVASNTLSQASMPPVNYSLDMSANTDNTMIPAQYVAKMDRMNRKVNELESTICYLKEDISEMQEKKTQVNQELAGLMNAKSSIKTINQRLNSIQFGFSRLLDRIEVLEKSAGIEDAFRSTHNTGSSARPIEFTNGNEEILNDPSNPLSVLSSGANRRGRQKHKRRAVEQGDRSTTAAAAAAPAPAFNVGTAAAAAGITSPADIAKMEELLALVVKQLAAMKLPPTANETPGDSGSATAPTTTSSSMDGDVPMSNGEGAQSQECNMGESNN